MGCLGLYRRFSVASAVAANATVRSGEQHHVVPAIIDGKEGAAVVDEADVATEFVWRGIAPAGHRLQRKSHG